MSPPGALCRVTWTTLPCGLAAAALGLFWTGPERGFDARATALIEEAAMGADHLTLAAVIAGAWAMLRSGAASEVVLAGVHTCPLCLHAGNAFGAVALNEAFPLHVAAMPLLAWGLILAEIRVCALSAPRGLAALPGASGIFTAVVRSLLL